MNTIEALMIAKPALAVAIQEAQRQASGLQLLDQAVNELLKENDQLKQQLQTYLQAQAPKNPVAQNNVRPLHPQAIPADQSVEEPEL
jgi:hypothetical protein